METMAYPCSPLIFPNQHEESSSYFLWSPRLESHHEINAGIGNMCGADPSPADADDQRRDHEFLTMMMVQDADDLCQDDELSNGDHLLVSGFCEEDGPMGQEKLMVMEESSLGDLLMAGAMAVDAGDLIHASSAVAKVDDILGSIAYDDAVGSLFDHLAGYFTRGLRSRIAGARTESHRTAPPPALPANRLPVYQMLQELSPFVKFAHFTANQAILEATMEDPDVHVIDFNVGDGVQWSSLMSDLATRYGSKPFHLTALTTGARSGAAGPTPRWLSEFAESLGLPFRFDSLYAHGKEEFREFAESPGNGDSSAIISCDATSMSHSSMGTSQMMVLLLSSIEVLQPKLVILIEDELFRIGRQPPPRSRPGLTGAPFSEFFSEALHHFAAVQESLASCFSGGGYEACLRLVEEEILCPTIESSVATTMTGGAGTGTAVAGFRGSGFRAHRLSGFNIAQAKMLAGLFSREFGVVHEEGRLALCWKDRPLTSVSVWSNNMLSRGNS